MTAIGALLEHPYAQALSWALVHFVWQGAAIGLVAWLVWRYAGWSARARYATGVAAMALMLIAPIVTVAIVGPRSATVSPTAMLIDKTSAPDVLAARDASAGRVANPVEPVEPFEPFVLALWLAGVLVLSARLLGGWFVARRFTTTGIAPVTAEIEQIARRIAREIGLVRLVRFFESTRVAVPVTIGWVKPVVLLPVSALSGLTASQIEALLAHELAHVRRHDYLVNLLQSAVETLLFYHPVVWWVSSRVRAEREDCCDDLAVRVCDRLVYVRALTDLASLAQPRLALAATDGSLVHRVRRILGEPGRHGATGSGWLSVMLALAIVGGVTPVMVASVFGPEKKEPPKTSSTVNQVAGGVVGGVTGGVPGGVSAGVASGVEGGVTGGVPAGVPGGVAGGVEDERQQSDIQAAARALRDLQAMEEAAARNLREAQSQLERDRLQIEIARLMADHKSEREFLAAQMEDTKRQIERIRSLAAAGQVTEDDAAKLREQLRLLEIKRAGVDQKLELAVRDVELKKRQTQQVDEYMRRQGEIADVRRARESEIERSVTRSMADYQALTQQYVEMLAQKQQGNTGGLDPKEWQARAERLRQLLAERETEIAELREAMVRQRPVGAERLDLQAPRLRELLLEPTDQELRALLRPREAALAAAVVIADADTARAGDIVRVELHDEPDLPQAYAVQSDGTIRLPLVGSVKVAGLNSRQVQDAVRKQFADRRLEAGANAVVSVRRPRTPRPPNEEAR